ncbi:hypothetical protein MSAN_00833900 [Mycena sanguinolenta]|uniref:Uncharacterized protein n=1 Tax=Mycena sanguinolenta TaxID=230812 RepID=A0A8H6Z0M8_9AGAR|nr:hypothetical protein MSAN_00833900 [Mycena sanguinolenta]
MQNVTEQWTSTRTSVTSTFTLCLQPSPGAGQRPTSTGAGVQYTGVCGFGWRFSFRVDAQSAPAAVVDEAGNTIDSFQLQLFFDPHLIRSASYGQVSLTVQVKNLIPVAPPALFQLSLPQNSYYGDNSGSPLGSYVYASTASTPIISITVEFSDSLGITLPGNPLEPRMERALEESLTGKELVDVKFYAFSRKRGDCVTHPLPLFAKSALLQGFSDDLDAFVTEHGFSESAIVDLDLHEPDEHSFDGYGYDSDSDLDLDWDLDLEDLDPEADGEKPTGTTTITPEASVSDGDVSSRLTRTGARMGRVIVLKDTAFRTWKALLYYLYTRRVNFGRLKSERRSFGGKDKKKGGAATVCSPKSMYRLGDKASPTEFGAAPVCSPKSMYRLADKLGLEELRVLALASITSRLSEDNILKEVFSFFTSMYPVIQELEAGVLASNFSDKATKGLQEMTDKICRGEKPYCAETLLRIMHTSGKTPPEIFTYFSIKYAEI